MPDHPAAKLCRHGTVPAGPVRVDQVQPEPVPDGPGPDQHREGPAHDLTTGRNDKARANGQRRPPWFFFCQRPAPISTAAATISTGKDRAAHGDGLPDLPGPPDEQRTARPITCPGCSFQPDPAALMTPPPCCRPPARPTDNASRQPASTPPPAQRRRGQILHLTGYGFRLRA